MEEITEKDIIQKIVNDLIDKGIIFIEDEEITFDVIKQSLKSIEKTLNGKITVL